MAPGATGPAFNQYSQQTVGTQQERHYLPQAKRTSAHLSSREQPMQQQSLVHHYLPRFYLRQWAGPDGLICEFSRPYMRVQARRKSPKATGHKPGLYTVTGLPPERQSILEDDFFRRTDQTAHDALRFMLANQDGTGDMPSKLRSGWSRFVLSLVHRTPERLALLKEKCRVALAERLAEIEPMYHEFRGPSDPPTFAQLKASMEHDAEHKTWALLLQDVVDSVTVGTFINAMRWSVVTVKNAPHSILTSDRPVYMTNGINHPEGQIILPIGPTRMFVAVNTPEMEDVLRTSDPHRLMGLMNDKVARHACRYVYGTDDRQLRYVENRLGRDIRT